MINFMLMIVSICLQQIYCFCTVIHQSFCKIEWLNLFSFTILITKFNWVLLENLILYKYEIYWVYLHLLENIIVLPQIFESFTLF